MNIADVVIKYGLEYRYSQPIRRNECFPALEGDSMHPGTYVPVEGFQLSGNDYYWLTNGDWSKYKIDVVTGAYTKTRFGPARCIEIRTPISIVEGSSFNEGFVTACCIACDKIYEEQPENRYIFDIRLLDGYVMAFFHIDEQYFLNLPQNECRGCLSYFLAKLEGNARKIRNNVMNFGFDHYF